MKIGLDLRMVGGGSGIDRYISELSIKLLELDKTNGYVLFFYRITPEIRSRYEKFGHKMVGTNIRHYSLAEQIKLPRILNGYNLDLVHFPHFNVPIFYNRPFVVTIHDLTHTKFPGRKKSHFIHRLAYNWTIHHAIKRAKKIIVISDSTKREIMEYFGVKSDKLVTVYEGVNDFFKFTDKEQALKRISNSFGINKPFLLYVGVMRRYKNLPMLAKAFDKLRRQGFDLNFVLAGEEDVFYPAIKRQIFLSDYASDIKFVGRVSEPDLRDLYNACELFVLPSLAEGFGLTALEAAACAAPIACSDIASLREVLGQGAEYFDPNNLENMTDVLAQLLKDSERMEELSNLALKRTKVFKWTTAAEETIKVYQGIDMFEAEKK